jgi:Zn-dependent protease with chaperone function
MLLALAAVPVVVSAVLGLGAHRVGGLLPPGSAVKVLAPTALVTALANGFCLSVVAFTALARIPLVASLGQWSVGVLGVDGTPPPVGGAVLGVLVMALLLMALRRSVRTATELTQAMVACRHLRALSDRLVLVEDDVADAFAVPGLRGKIVITTGMLKALDPRERQALIAHEQAHLAHHHQLYIQAADLAAAANPLLRPTATHVRKLTERWADEEAARTVDDRHLTARALAKAALARAATRRDAAPPLAMAASAGDVAERAVALTRPAPASRPRVAGVILTLGIASLLASLWAAHTTEATFEHAHAVYDTAYGNQLPGRTGIPPTLGDRPGHHL